MCHIFRCDICLVFFSSLSPLSCVRGGVYIVRTTDARHTFTIYKKNFFFFFADDGACTMNERLFTKSGPRVYRCTAVEKSSGIQLRIVCADEREENGFFFPRQFKKRVALRH